ncbi:hypothetical protein [Streptomyces sp. SID13726]|uniref:hypothetical protein n=1 Tax=Streptomyces sp. SID13726 TaxID=2706058 RepID=UPI0013BDE67A|nr:hypothetical protein [Streptomyces sp. SID13726]NEB03771.1 hypothetical protein [Streptomyces sp. SID13726]
MGKASRKKQERRSRRAAPGEIGTGGDPQNVSADALEALLRSNAPDELSLAGAYAFGYLALAAAQLNEDVPDWFHSIDPLDTLFLGTAWPKAFVDELQFANARDAWLRLLHGTVHGKGIERFVRETVAASEELEMPVDDGEFLLALTGRLASAGLDRRRLPRRLLPGAALQGCRAVCGPSPDLRLPEPPEDAKERVRQFWKETAESSWTGSTPRAILRNGLRRFKEQGLPVKKESALLLGALYAALLTKPGEPLDDMGEHAWTWAMSLDETSSLVPVLDILALAPELGLSVTETLGRLFAVPAFTQPIPSEALIWTSSPGLALPRLAFELGVTEVSTVDRTITPDLLDWVGMHARMDLSTTVRRRDVDDETSDDGPQDEDGPPAESDGQWDERREAVRVAALNKVRKKSGKTAASPGRSRPPVERIWNADGSSVVRFDEHRWQKLADGMEGLCREFREKFGREPGPDDPLFFDPDADEPMPLSREHFDDMLRDVADRAVEHGVDPAFLHAWREVGYVVTEENMSMFTAAEVLTFSRAVARYRQGRE